MHDPEMQSPINDTLSLIISDRLQEIDVASLSAADWNQLIATASSEGVTPLVYWGLSQSGKLESLPEAPRNSLSAAYAVTWFQNERLFQELEVLARLFDDAGIPVVVLKGACFALTVYPDVGLRQMGDLDLLVPADKLDEAAGIARSRDFTETLPEASPGLNDLLSHHVRLQTSEPLPLVLEIHNSLVADRVFTYAVPVDWFWSQTESLGAVSHKRFGSLRMLTPAAQVLYAAAHAMLQHGGRSAPLLWFYDLHLLIRHHDRRMDWDLLVSQARKFEWGSALRAALTHTQACFSTPIPEHVVAGLLNTSDRHQALVARLQNKPATRFIEEQEKLIRLNWYARGRVILALLVPSPSYMSWRYELKSSWSLPVYYIIRWWGILRDGLRTLQLLIRS